LLDRCCNKSSPPLLGGPIRPMLKPRAPASGAAAAWRSPRAVNRLSIKRRGAAPYDCPSPGMPCEELLSDPHFSEAIITRRRETPAVARCTRRFDSLEILGREPWLLSGLNLRLGVRSLSVD